ncbi:MAG: CoA-binding protein [Planctomycetota bacterium JB042]
MSTHDAIERFLAGDVFAVVGASADRSKYGNKVLRCYLQNGREAHPINPKGGTIEGRTAYPDLESVPEPIDGVSFITPPAVTLALLESCRERGIERVWMQPGSESPEVVARAEELGLDAIADGSCLLVVLGFRD